MALGGMFGGSGDILIKVGADVRGAVSELGKVNDAVDETGKSGGRMRAGLESAAAPAAAALAGLAVVAVKSAKAAAEDQASREKLEGQMRRSTDATNAQITATESWIDSTSRAVAVADDDLRPALGNLIRATGDAKKAQELLKLALDTSAATGKPLESVTSALGKAYTGNVGALARLVPSLKDAADKGASFKEIQKLLNEQVQGAAAGHAQTAAGQYEAMSIAINELQESIGAALLPALQTALPVLTAFFDLAGKHTGAVVAAGAAVAGLAVAVLAVNAAMKVAAAATKIYAAANWVLDAALAANPITLVVIAVIALGAALVVAYKKSETFRNIVDNAFDAVVSAGEALAGPIEDFIGFLQTAWGHAKTLGRIAVDAFNSILGAIQPVIDAIGDIIGAIGRIHWPSKPSWVPFSVPGAVGFPAPLMVGPGAFAADAGGMNVTITVTGAIDPEATAQQIRRILNRYDRRRGQRPLGGEAGGSEGSG